MDGRSQSRKYQLTINSPKEHGISDDMIKDILRNKLTLNYFALRMKSGLKKGENMYIYFCIHMHQFDLEL